MKTIKEIYENHSEMPFVLEKYEQDLIQKPIPKRNMERTVEGLLPGHIIMLWRISFGTYTTENPHHKYFYTTYGIDPVKELDWLISENYVQINSAFDSMEHLSAIQLKDYLKVKDVKGLSKMKRSDIDATIKTHFTEEEFGNLFSLRAYQLTDKGQEMLAAHPEIVAKHPQKKY